MAISNLTLALALMIIASLIASTCASFNDSDGDSDNDAAYHNTVLAHSPFYGRVVSIVVSLILMSGISGMLATRLKVLRPRHYRSLTALRALTILSYLTSLLFIFGANLLLSAWTYLPTPHICHLGIMICLAFYVAAKTLLYLFLLERAIMLRTHPNRYHDPVYIAGLVIIIAGLGSIAIISFLRPVASVSPTDAICRIGLPKGALIPLLTYDVLINIALTGLYIWLTNRISQNLTWAAVGGVALAMVWPGRKYGPLETQASMLQLMMAKSILGTVAAVVVTAANLAVLIGVRGHEQDWLCFTVCCVDIAWSVVIIHWLTSNPLVDLGEQPHALRTQQQSPARPERENGNELRNTFDRI